MLQKDYLERAGHKVSVVAPAGDFAPSDSVVTYPSWPLTPSREFSFTMKIGSAIKVLNQKFSQGQPVDLVHVQADNWGALIGARFALEHNLPQVNTLHTNLEHALVKIVGKAASSAMVLGLSTGFAFLSKQPGCRPTTSAWKYLGMISANADLILVPTLHFAKLAMKMGVAKDVQVLSNGVDDEFALAKIEPKSRKPKTTPVQFLWCGRISHEKRIMQFMQAIKIADLSGEVKIYGSGDQLAEAQEFVSANGLANVVEFCGRLNHHDILLKMKEADVMVQTSSGFETQGMTVYEAGVMGTPSVICDRNIALDLPAGSNWLVADDSIEALAKTLKQAELDVAAGNTKVIDLRNQMAQSKLTGKALGYYQLAINLHAEKSKEV
ncbi:MAG: hypothetical protein RL556_337 [Actinomycetota bacterium]